MKELDLIDEQIKDLNDERNELNECINEIKDKIEIYNSMRDKLIIRNRRNLKGYRTAKEIDTEFLNKMKVFNKETSLNNLFLTFEGEVLGDNLKRKIRMTIYEYLKNRYSKYCLNNSDEFAKELTKDICNCVKIQY